MSTTPELNAIAAFLKLRDESITPDEADDAERLESAKAILEALAAPCRESVAVKALEWRDHSFGESILHTAEVPYGQYSITFDKDCEWPFVVRPFLTKQSNYETLTEAKADCEADYETRIRSALASPVPQGEAVAWRGIVDGRTAFLCRTNDEVARLASDYNAVIEPLYASPRDAVTEALHSCVCLLDTMADEAKKRDDIPEWSMMTTMAERCRLVLTASPASHGVVTEEMAERFSAGVSKYWQGRRSGRDGDAILAGLAAALAPSLAEQGVDGEDAHVIEVIERELGNWECDGPDELPTTVSGMIAAERAIYRAAAPEQEKANG